MGDRTILLSAGGTGGHLFPAEALAHELGRRGWAVHLATDGRASAMPAVFPPRQFIRSRPRRWARAIRSPSRATGWTLWRGFVRLRALIQRLKPTIGRRFWRLPDAAAALCGDAARGSDADSRAERRDGPRQQGACRPRHAIAGGFHEPEARGFPEKTVVTGNPVRPAVMEALEVGSIQRAGARRPFRLLVFGGSQGAQFFVEALPLAVEKLPADQRSRLRSRSRRVPRTRIRSARPMRRSVCAAEVSPFFADMAARIADGASRHFSRSGASTVSELAASAARRFWCLIRLRSTTIRAPMRRRFRRPAVASSANRAI